jgi:hypothetical protein
MAISTERIFKFGDQGTGILGMPEGVMRLGEHTTYEAGAGMSKIYEAAEDTD